MQCFCLLVVTIFLNIVFGLHLYSFCCPALVLLLRVFISPSLSLPLSLSLPPSPCHILILYCLFSILNPVSQRIRFEAWAICSDIRRCLEIYKEIEMCSHRENEKEWHADWLVFGDLPLPSTPSHCSHVLLDCRLLILRGKRAETPLSFCAQHLVRQLLQVHWLLPLLSASTRHLLHLGVSQSFPF